MRTPSQKEMWKNHSVRICKVASIFLITLFLIKEFNKPEKSRKEMNYWVYSSTVYDQNEHGLLRHVHIVLKRLGYSPISRNGTTWDLLWVFGCYSKKRIDFNKVEPHQRLNLYPGVGSLVSKVSLATTKLEYIPQAFRLPKEKNKFLKYASENKHLLFVEKGNTHRGIRLKNVSDIDYSSGQKFVQQYVQNPFLVDGHKFDIGVYVAIMSVKPLRAYWYKGDVGFRYCPLKYYPFDASEVDKYVIADRYLPTWEVPSLARPFTAHGFGMKDSFEIYMKSKGKDTTRMWEDVHRIIAEVLLHKEKYIVKALKSHRSPDNFFQLTRFDLLVDENLKVYLLEANLSPNLRARDKPANQVLYQQILYNLFSLAGYSSPQEKDPKVEISTTEKDISVWGAECAVLCTNRCDGVCRACAHCLSDGDKRAVLRAYREYIHRGDFRRVFPPAMEPTPLKDVNISNLTPDNQVHYLWFQGKCNVDVTWCY